MFSFLKRRLLFAVAFLVFILLLNMYQYEVRSFFYSFSSPLLSFFWKAGGTLSNFFSPLFQGARLAKENESVLEGNLKLLKKVAELQAAEKENREFRQAFQLEKKTNFDLAAAQIIGRDLSGDLIIISKGALSGIFPGMAVITSAGVLVGRVAEVFKDTGKVMTLTDKNSSFDARVLGKEIHGLAKGMGQGKLIFDLVPKGKALALGDLITTSSFGEIFPENLLVGTVKHIEKKDVDNFQKAELDPLFRLEESRMIFIVL